ncbi:MAG: FMN-binding protein [Chloroflexota bacterium]
MRSRPSSAAGPGLNPIPPRAVVAIVTTALGVVLLVTFRTPDSLPPRTAGAVVSPDDIAPGQSAPSRASSSTGGGSSTPKPSANASSVTVTGDDVQNQFGDVQVQVTFTAGRITAVKALKLPYDRRRSAEISQFVEPYLRSEALQAQSAQIDLISGATYTSDSYARSLQSAIDKAHG